CGPRRPLGAGDLPRRGHVGPSHRRDARDRGPRCGRIDRLEEPQLPALRGGRHGRSLADHDHRVTGTLLSGVETTKSADRDDAPGMTLATLARSAEVVAVDEEEK